MQKSPLGGGDDGDDGDGGGGAGRGGMLPAPFLTPVETKILVLLSALVERFFVPRIEDFLAWLP